MALDLNSTFKEEFNHAEERYFTPRLLNGTKIGNVKTAGRGAGNFTFLTIDDVSICFFSAILTLTDWDVKAEHMVPASVSNDLCITCQIYNSQPAF
jgi:hypothetical protein